MPPRLSQPIAGDHTGPHRPHADTLTGDRRSYARPAMPAPEPTRRTSPPRLRHACGRRGRTCPPSRPSSASRTPSRRTRRPARSAALPRPVTPPEPRPEPAARGSTPPALPMPSLSRRRVVTAAGHPRWRACSPSASCARSARPRPRPIAPPTCAPRTPRCGRGRAPPAGPRRTSRTRASSSSRAGRSASAGRGEIPFALAAGRAGARRPTRPGSAAVRLGAEPLDRSPLDAWLEVLFGSG